MGLGVVDIVFISKNQLACSPLNINSSVLSYRLSSKKKIDFKKFIPAPLYLYGKIGHHTFKSHSEPWQNHQILPLTTSFLTSHPSTLASHLHMGHARVMAKIGRCQLQGQPAQQPRPRHHSNVLLCTSEALCRQLRTLLYPLHPTQRP